MKSMNRQELLSLIETVGTMVKIMTRNAQNAEDVCQEVMIKILLSNVAPLEQHPGWLKVVTRNCVIDAYRRLNRHLRFYGKDMYLAADGAVYFRSHSEPCYTPATNTELAEPDMMLSIQKMLTTLPAPQRQVLMLTINGLSYAEVAAATGTTVGTVRSRLHYGRQRAKELWQQIA